MKSNLYNYKFFYYINYVHMVSSCNQLLVLQIIINLLILCFCVNEILCKAKYYFGYKYTANLCKLKVYKLYFVSYLSCKKYVEMVEMTNLHLSVNI